MSVRLWRGFSANAVDQIFVFRLETYLLTGKKLEQEVGLYCSL
jgi:hypothetical protein